MKPISGNYKPAGQIVQGIQMYRGKRHNVSVEDRPKFYLIGISRRGGGRKPSDEACQEVLADFGFTNAKAWRNSSSEIARYFEVQK